MGAEQIALYNERLTRYDAVIQCFNSLNNSIVEMLEFMLLLPIFITAKVINWQIKKMLKQIYRNPYPKKFSSDLLNIFKRIREIQKRTIDLMELVKKDTAFHKIPCNNLISKTEKVLTPEDIEDYMENQSIEFIQEMGKIDREYKKGNFFIYDKESDKYIRHQKKVA